MTRPDLIVIVGALLRDKDFEPLDGGDSDIKACAAAARRAEALVDRLSAVMPASDAVRGAPFDEPIQEIR